MKGERGQIGPHPEKTTFKKPSLIRVVMKFGTQANSNTLSLMGMFNCTFLDWKYPFWVNFIPKVKLFCKDGI